MTEAGVRLRRGMKSGNSFGCNQIRVEIISAKVVFPITLPASLTPLAQFENDYFGGKAYGKMS
jgi:hypothetical protein